MGNKIGAKHIDTANRAAYAGIISTFCYTFLVALTFWLIPHKLIALDFSHTKVNPQMIDITIKLFSVAAIFQLIESIRISLFGALRALKNTKFTLLSSLIGCWGGGITMGYTFYHTLKIGPSSYWLVLSLGAVINAILLF